MAAYIIGEVTITDPEKMAQYREWSTRAMQEFGVKVLARTNDVETLEGGWQPQRIVLLEFPDLETAKNFYYGETYTHARSLRQDAGFMRMIALQGA